MRSRPALHVFAAACVLSFSKWATTAALASTCTCPLSPLLTRFLPEPCLEFIPFNYIRRQLLERVIMGDPIVTAIHAVAKVLKAGTGNPNDHFFAHALDKMAEWAKRLPYDVTLELGQACDFPFHVFTATHFLTHYNGNITCVHRGGMR